MSIKLTGLALSFLFIIGCLSSNKNGIYQTKSGDTFFRREYKKGILIMEMKFTSNKENPPLRYILKTFQPNGVLAFSRTYVKGMKEGVSYEYYASGKLFTKSNYKNDLLDGTRYLYSEGGKLLGLSNYMTGMERGIKELFDESGRPNYISMKLNDTSTLFIADYSDGKIKRFRGELIHILVPKDTFKTEEHFKVLFNVCSLPKMRTEVRTHLYYQSGKQFFDTTVSTFRSMKTSPFFFIEKPIRDKGVLIVEVNASLFDSVTQKTIKTTIGYKERFTVQ